MLQIIPIPAFDDNYIWLLRQPDGKHCVAVDPGDEDPVIDYLRSNKLTLSAILITHKHGDHTAGVRALKQIWPDVVVHGPANESITALDRQTREGDTLLLEDINARFSVLDVPGHTEGHVAYYGEGCVLCGDTLFAGGCGRVFSGTYDQLSNSLIRLGRLPPETRVYCAHEYTLSNLGFALWVEPGNADLLARNNTDKAAREKRQPTLPSTIRIELATNPFMRTDQLDIIAAAENWRGQKSVSRHEVFRALREWKDQAYD